MLGDQLAADAAEDVLFGVGQRGDELPASLRRRADRVAAIEAARADLAARERAAREAMRAEQKAKQDAYDARAGAGDRPRGPRPREEVAYGPGPQDPPARASTTDVDSRRMKAKHGFVQGYNTQVAVTEDHVIVGVLVSQNATDHHLLAPVLDRVEAELAAAGITAGLDTVLADAGYANEDSFTHAAARGLRLLAPLSADKKRAIAADGTWDPADGADLSTLPATATSQNRLRGPEGQALYALRGHTVEPVIGQLKDRRGLRTFTRRGLPAVQAEASLAATVHNLCKYHKHHLRNHATR